MDLNFHNLELLFLLCFCKEVICIFTKKKEEELPEYPNFAVIDTTGVKRYSLTSLPPKYESVVSGLPTVSYL